ncbi:MAG: hypothetical protein K6G48_05440 [Acholeplasmatales bacterium]|nr:hypothetical protein [Acholeplasmatales bacterium]
MKKSFISLAVLGLSTMALVSCGATVNSETPYGNISNTDSYATLGDYSISKKQLYDLMRSSGYSTVLQKIKEDMFSDIVTDKTYFEYSEANDPDDYYTINQNLVSAIYGAASVEAYKELTDEEKATQIEKYVDTLFNNGTKKSDGSYFTKADIEAITISYTTDENGDDQFVAEFPYELYESYIFDMAMSNYALAQLKNKDFKYYYGNKYISGVGENNYYVEDEDVSDYYYSTGKYFREYRGIVIKFASYAQAERVMQQAFATTGSSTIDSSNFLEQYLTIYNIKNATKSDLTEDNYLTDEQTNLSVTKEKNRLTSNYSATFETFFKEMEDGDYLDKPFNVDGSYYLAYRISGEEVVEWDELDDSQKVAGDGTTVYDEMLDYILENKSISTLASTIVSDALEELVDDDAIEIYDPLIGYNFKQDYDDFTYTSTANNDYVYKFTYEGEEYTYTPEELYEELEPANGTSLAVSYLKNQWALDLSYMEDLIDDDTYDDYKDDLSDEIKSFKKGNKDVSKKLGTSTYLQITYGVSTKAEVLANKKASMILDKVASYFGNPVTSDSTFDTTSTLFTQFADIYEDLYDAYFSASISHILISVDEDYSGSYSDPDAYRASLEEIDSTLADEFDQAVLNIVNAIISEVQILTNLDNSTKTVTEALSYIVDAFNNNYKIGSLSYTTGHDVYWNDLKTVFPIVLTTEDLSEIDLFSASNYMEEFSTRVKELYDKVIDGTYDEDEMEETGIFEFTTTQTSLDSLCKTTYGYHILNIYDTDEVDSAKFESSSDSKADEDDEYMQYEHLEVVLIPDDADGGDDDDDDPEYVIYANGYSDTVYASASQLFVYFYEQTIMGSHSLLKTSVNTAISTVFSGAITFYTSTNFQNWKYLTYELADLTFTDDADKKAMYTDYLARSLFSYSTHEFTLYTDWTDTTKYNWSIDYDFIWS